MSTTSFSRSQASRTSRPGLTNIELIVSIAILLILAAILFPITNSILEKSRRIKCASNLRQVGTVIQLYMVEHNGWTPTAAYSYAGGGDNSYWNAYRNDLEPYMDVNSPVYRCPEGMLEFPNSSRSRYRMQPRSSSANPQAWHTELAPARPYDPLQPSEPGNMVLMLDTRPYHGWDHSPLLFFDNSVRIGEWRDYFNENVSR